MFLLVVEVFAIAIKESKRISGVKIDSKEYRMTDKTTFFISDT